MDATTREEAPRPLGVAACLLAGFEMVGRHLGLMVLPVLVDLFLWLGPRISVVPLLDEFSRKLVAQMPSAGQGAQIAEMLEQFGEQFNLLSLLSSLPLLHVPSLLSPGLSSNSSPLGEPTVVQVGDEAALTLWVVGLLLGGVVLGALYLRSLARRAGVASILKGEEGEEEERVSLGGELARFARVLLFAIGLLVGGVVFGPIWMSVVAMAAGFGEQAAYWALLLSAMLVGYVVVHLAFVVHGVLAGGRGLLRAAWESLVFTHAFFPYVLVLLLLVSLIAEGLEYVWKLPSGDSWFFLVGIVGHACVVTALTGASFVFYRERMALLAQAQQAAGRA